MMNDYSDDDYSPEAVEAGGEAQSRELEAGLRGDMSVGPVFGGGARTGAEDAAAVG